MSTLVEVQHSLTANGFEGMDKIENDFDRLVAELSKLLGPSSGLDSDDVNVSDIVQLMQGYASKSDEWAKYAFADPSRGYTRNLVDSGNGKSNLLVLVWSPGKGSPIHDHANAHCVMKILSGQLQETLYNWPADYSAAPLSIKRDRIYEKDQVTYMSDHLGLHKIMNPDPNNVAVSLHLYTPPNAAKHGCYMFNEKSGVGTHILQSHFFSEFGKKM